MLKGLLNVVSLCFLGVFYFCSASLRCYEMYVVGFFFAFHFPSGNCLDFVSLILELLKVRCSFLIL